MLSLRSNGVVVVRSLVLVAVVLALSVAIAGCRRQRPSTQIGGEPANHRITSPGGVEETASARSEDTTSFRRDDALAKQYPFDRITTREMFDRLVRSADKPVVVFFVSKTCEVCKKVGERLTELTQEFEDTVDFYVVVKPAAMEVVMEMKVHVFPTIHLFFDGRKVNEWTGLDIGDLRVELNRLLGNE